MFVFYFSLLIKNSTFSFRESVGTKKDYGTILPLCGTCWYFVDRLQDCTWALQIDVANYTNMVLISMLDRYNLSLAILF